MPEYRDGTAILTDAMRYGADHCVLTVDRVSWEEMRSTGRYRLDTVPFRDLPTPRLMAVFPTGDLYIVPKED